MAVLTYFEKLFLYCNKYVQKATFHWIYGLFDRLLPYICRIATLRTYYLTIILALTLFPTKASESIFFTPNRGQWDSRIQYQMEIPGGYFYLEKNAHTYYFIERPHHHPGEPDHDHEMIKHHAFKTTFIGSNPNSTFIEEKQTGFYYNYFLNNDPSKWKTGVYSYKQITYKNLYEGIDYVIGEKNQELKSDYIVHPGDSPQQIQLNYEGADKLYIENGKLIIKTSLATVTENMPVAYQMINGQKIAVDCEYELKGNVVSFKLGQYQSAFDLVIDPVLYFSTYIGATADNFGCTATYDASKNVYGGALVYSTGVYPTTFGAFQTTHSSPGGTHKDMGITKFDASGTSLQFSTYLGGSLGTEVPHSLVVDANGNLFVFGTTGSSNYPVTAGAYDVSFNGGPAAAELQQGLDYPSGTDIVITKFNPTGTALLGSTFLGGTHNDGINSSTVLNYNYGDFIRGEIIVDGSDNPIICSSTYSNNFPVTASAPQTVFGGACDAIVTKLNSNLTGLIWSTYHGGTGDDAGYGMQPDAAGDLFFTGGTTSNNLPVTGGTYDNTHNGGADGYIAKINPAGTTLLASTYLGTAAYDQSFLIQTDLTDNVYVFGQSIGTYPQTAGIYNNGNSGQFIHKFNNDLTTSLWSTRIGRGSGQVDISPTAFLLNKCNKIYICGWGGLVNTYKQADFSTTNGLNVTGDAFQGTTDGSDFYLAIFTPDMATFEYGTFFGGPTSTEHVDGGTARFDKDGFVYQAICAGCGGNDDFPTTPGAWSNTNNSTNCNLAVFKFNMDTIIASAFSTTVSPFCTLPATVDFDNLSTNADTFIWDFGDGTPTSTDPNPSHNYAASGTYTVTLIAIDTNYCNDPDTLQLTIFIPEPFSLTTPPGDTLCIGESSSYSISTTGTFTWTPSTGVSDPTSGVVTLSPIVSTNYMAIGTNVDGCSDTVEIYIHVHVPPVADFNLVFDTCNIPATFTFTNSSTESINFFWDFGDGFTSTATNPNHVYSTPGNYTITLIAYDMHGCGFHDTITKPVYIPAPLVITVTGDNQICLGESTQMTVTGGATFTWTPSGTLDNGTIFNPIATPGTTTTYTVVAVDTNGCADTMTFPITVIQPPTAAFTANFTPCTIPNNVSFTNGSTNSGTFIWLLDGIVVSGTDITHVFNTPGNYTITLIAVDTSGCGFNDTTSMDIFLPPPAQALAWGSDTICIGQSLQLFASGGDTYYWLPPSLFNDNTLSNPILTPDVSGDYSVIVTDTNGCSDTASVPVYIFPVPTIDAGSDLIYDFGEGPLLNPTLPTSGSFYWTPPTGLSCTDCLRPEATPEVTTTYYIVYTDDYGCVYTDSLVVLVTPTVYIPNAFTPNGDLNNDFFFPVTRNLRTFNFYIFNRWGELIFETDDKNAVWDGSHNGVKCKSDVYVWKLKYTSDLEPYSIKEITGHVTLLR